MTLDKINQLFAESAEVKTELIRSGTLEVLVKMGETISNSIRQGGKLLLCGNGGSAADAQHLAAELLVRLRPKHNRASLPAITLAQDTSTITACGNDFGYDQLFARTLESLGQQQDILLAITTSGNSTNIVNAIDVAKQKGMTVLGFLGGSGGKVLPLCDLAFVVPSSNTGRIQESHITAGHALMEFIEDSLLDSGHIELYSQ